LGFDEAELLVTTQALAPGYGSQPPLYTWLQTGVLDLLGIGIPALALLKEFFLWATFMLVFLSAKLVLDDDRKAAVAALSLFTIPQIVWESQRALSHTVVSVTVASATLYVTLRLLRDPRRLWSIVLGVCWALGSLSKYNYLFFAIALAVTAGWLSSPRVRKLMLLSLLIAVLLILPHLVWVWQHLGETLARAHKFSITSNAGLLDAWGRGLVALVAAVVSYGALPVLVVALVVFLPMPGRSGDGAGPAVLPPPSLMRKLMVYVIPVALAIVLAAAFIARATAVRDRWLQPVLFVLPLSLMVLYEGRLTRLRLNRLGGTAVLIALIAIVGLVATHLFPDQLHQTQRDAVPYPELAAQIRGLGFEQGYIIADSTYTAGNLKLQFPGSTVAEPQYGLWPAGDNPAGLLLAWSGTGTTLPEDMRALFVELCRADPPAQQAVHLTAAFPNSRRFHLELNALSLPMCDRAAK
jgi:4-amino-4-deoxy-L-arabinose transferase-like glycosyltransferase